APALAASCLALALAVPALAGDIPAESKIDAVTVYPDAAAVTRIADIALPDGTSRVVFKGLPIDLDPGSLRVEARATASVVIGSVDSRIAPAEAVAIDSGLEARIRSLKAERETVQVAIEALQGKKAMILRLSQTPVDRASAGGKPLDVD